MEEMLQDNVEDTIVQDDNLEFEAIYNDKGEELLFEEGPTLNQIEEWKSRYKDIYFTEFDDEVFIWRCLNRKEYKDVMKVQNADMFYKEERICDKCVIWPSNFNHLAMANAKAGIPTFLGEQIMEKSGFSASTVAMKL